jgi:hypothetical protein
MAAAGDIINDGAVAGAGALLLTLAALTASDEVRSIGIVPSVSITAGAGKKLHVRLQTVAGS